MNKLLTSLIPIIKRIMIKENKNIIVLFALSALVGCSSLEGRHVKAIEDIDGKPIIENAKGVSYYLTKPTFEIQRKTKNKGKSAQPVYEVVINAKPDPSRRFEVGMNQGWFTTDTFELNLSEDARVKSLTGSSSDQTARVIAGLGKLAAAVAGTVLKGGVGDLADLRPSCSPPSDAPRFSSELPGIFLIGSKNKLISSEESEQAVCYIDLCNKACPATPPPLIDSKKFIKIAKDLLKGLIETDSGDDTQAFKGMKRRVKDLEGKDFTGLPPSSDKALNDIIPIEKNVIMAFNWIEILSNDIADENARNKSPSTVEIIAEIKKELDKAIAIAVKNPTTANKNKVDRKAEKLRDAINLVVKADEMVNGRGLSKRRDVLSEFLKRPIPQNARKGMSKRYSNYAAQLNKVMVAINNLIGAGGGSSTKADLPLATEVTSRITRNVFVYRWNVALNQVELKKRMILAKARVTYGSSAAAVITFPSLNQWR
jgi:hypothetical protein